MKKLLKIIILVIGFLPLLVSAEEKEVNYKWYKIIEDNIKYISDAENICEYFDKTMYITSDWYYETVKPKEESYRIIENINIDLDISRLHTKSLEIRYFPITDVKIFELEFINSNNEIIDYQSQERINGQNTNKLNDKNFEEFYLTKYDDIIKIELNEIINMEETTIKIYHEKNEDFKELNIYTYATNDFVNNAFGEYEELIETNCIENKCVTEIKLKENSYLKDPLKITTNGYRYKDKYYKCFDKVLSYAPGYHENLENEGYIKDENTFIEIPKEKTQIKNICESDIKENTNLDTITDDITNQVNNSVSTLKKPISMVSKETTKKETSSFLIFITTFSILSILLTIFIITKKIRKCRLK